MHFTSINTKLWSIYNAGKKYCIIDTKSDLYNNSMYCILEIKNYIFLIWWLYVKIVTVSIWLDNPCPLAPAVVFGVWTRPIWSRLRGKFRGTRHPVWPLSAPPAMSISSEQPSSCNQNLYNQNPQIFNQVQIGRIPRPIQQLDTCLRKQLFHSASCVAGCWILLEDLEDLAGVNLHKSGQLVLQHFKVLLPRKWSPPRPYDEKQPHTITAGLCFSGCGVAWGLNWRSRRTASLNMTSFHCSRTSLCAACRRPASASHLEGEEGLLSCFSRGEFEVTAQAVANRPCRNFLELWDCTLKSSRGHWGILLDFPKDDVVQPCWGLPWSSRLLLGHPKGYLIDYPGYCSLVDTEDCCNNCSWHACLMQPNDAIFLSCA